MTAKTFKQWITCGFVVNKGQKATGRNSAGIPTFTRDQVKLLSNPEPGDYDYDEDQYYDDYFLDCGDR